MTNSDLIDCIENITKDSGGVLKLAVVRPVDVPKLLARALTGDSEAARTLLAVTGSRKQILNAPKLTPMLCASCPRPLRQGKYCYAVALPERDDPRQALGMAVCTKCATTPAQVMTKAIGAMRGIWPSIRQIEITHPHRGGRA